MQIEATAVDGTSQSIAQLFGGRLSLAMLDSQPCWKSSSLERLQLKSLLYRHFSETMLIANPDFPASHKAVGQ